MDLEAQIADKVKRKEALASLSRVSASHDYGVFKDVMLGRIAKIRLELEANELNSYQLGRLQGRLMELKECMLDPSVIEKEALQLQAEIDRLRNKQGRRSIREAMKPVDPRRSK